MVGFTFYTFIEVLKKGNQTYSILHLSQANFLVFEMSFTKPFLGILWLEVDLHFGHFIIINFL